MKRKKGPLQPKLTAGQVTGMYRLQRGRWRDEIIRYLDAQKLQTSTHGRS